MHIVLVYHHCYQLINQHKTDDHSRYGDNHILRQSFNHVENAGVPCAGCGCNLPRNRAYLVIDIGKHGVEVAKYPPFEYILYELSNFFYNAAHLSYENSVESCGITVCATMIMPPPDISCLMP